MAPPAALGVDGVVHHLVPVLTSQDLEKIFCFYGSFFTWNTVSKALVMESKLDVGRPSGKLNWPPNS